MNPNSALAAYGIPSTRFQHLAGAPTAETLDYLDLHALPERTDSTSAALRPDGVAKSAEGPLLYIINESRLCEIPKERDTQLQKLREKLACRGNTAYLARIQPGQLVVTPVSLDQKAANWVTYSANAQDSSSFFSSLANGLLDGTPKRAEADFVFSAMFKLVWSVADRLAKLRIKRTDVLSLVGRALFFRFLYDRNIVREIDALKILPTKDASIREAFDNPVNAAAACRWLDKTFNGDLLPLSESNELFFQEMGKRSGGRVFSHLSAILTGEEPVGDEEYQKPLPMKFGDFDFAHIPVGLLSQVYERFAWKWEHDNAKDTSVHYTPRNIAASMVEEVFDGLPNAHTARVLDPACGASVFLVLAFRRLYKERWQHDGRRPGTKAIRQILEKQLTGFDISESAIRLASLSLYLTAIELDPNPVPPEKLTFTHLRDKVLFNFRRKGIDPDDGAIAGSLDEHVPQKFKSAFDVVLGNPPWTSLKPKEKALATSFENLSRKIIESRGDTEMAKAYQNPDLAPDFPFIWKATEWCKKDGRIALALPGRILLKQEAIPRKARETLLRLVEVTGIVNGSNLSDTRVWPDMAQPFVLLFALNRVPKSGHCIHFITPQYDETLNRKGHLRIDSKSAQALEVESTFETPWMWKALSVGTSLDVDVTRRLLSSGHPSIKEYWEDTLDLSCARGYDVEGTPQKNATHLVGKPNLTEIKEGIFEVDAAILDPFERETLYRPKDPKIYKAPLFLLKQAPGLERENARGLITGDEIVYSRTFHGYSANSAINGLELVTYLHLFAHSEIPMYFALGTRPRFGAERRVIDKADFDECPIVPYEKLKSSQQQKVNTLSQRLLKRDLTVFPEIDSFFGQLFDFDARDMQVIRDTVETAMPFQKSRQRACNPPKPVDRKRFCTELKKLLLPFFTITNEEPEFTLQASTNSSANLPDPFLFIRINIKGKSLKDTDQSLQSLFLKLAEESGSTRVIQEQANGLLIGVFNQYRYWTPSRARLLAAEIAREHLDVFDS
jgi:hypothetical protein